MGSAAKIAVSFFVVVFVGVIALCVWGFGLYSDEVCARLRAEPAIVDKLGPLSSCEHQLLSSGDIDDLDTFVFGVEGPLGSAKVFVKSTSTGDDGNEEYQGILLVAGGEEILVFGERPPTK